MALVHTPPTVFDVPYVGWDAVTIGSNMSLSSTIGANSRVTRTSPSATWFSARSAKSNSSGKWYAEILSVNNAAGLMLFGFGDSVYPTSTAGSALGVQANSASIRHIDSAHTTGWTLNIGGDLGGTDAVGDVWMLAADLDNSKMYAGVNGVWFGGSNPTTGTNKWVTPNTLPVFVGVSINNGALSAELRTLLRQFSFTPPADFIPWAGN